MEKPICDKSKYFVALKLMQQYQIGEEYFMIRENKIVKGNIYKVSAAIRNQWEAPKIDIALEFTIELSIGSSVIRVSRTDLFKTKEEAAEQFLKDNDVPAELLEVLKPAKPKTTVADLIDKINQIDPTTDLDEEFWPLLKVIEKKYIAKVMPEAEAETTPDYWDCDCDVYYIHSAFGTFCPICNKTADQAPNSRINEVKTGEHFFKDRKVTNDKETV